MDKWTLEMVYEDVLAFGIGAELKEDVAIANALYIGDDDLQEAQGFDEWYIFNYRSAQNGKSIIDLAAEKGIDNALKLKDSFRSFFQVSLQRESVYIKDIFTGEDYLLIEENMSEGAIVSLRIGYSETLNGYVPICESYNFEPLYKDVIKKYVMAQYNEYVKEFGPLSVNEFIQRTLKTIFKMHNIVNALYDELEVEEELLLHEATYAFTSSVDEIFEQLEGLPFDLYVDEEESDIIRIIHDEVIIAELEVMAPKLNVLCNNASHLKLMKKAIDALGLSSLIFLKEETLTIDGVLN